MSTFERLLNVCTAVFEGEIDTAAITEASNLREDVSINSIGLLYMAMALEEEFGIKFTNDDFPQFVTVGDVVNYLSEIAEDNE